MFLLLGEKRPRLWPLVFMRLTATPFSPASWGAIQWENNWGSEPTGWDGRNEGIQHGFLRNRGLISAWSTQISHWPDREEGNPAALGLSGSKKTRPRLRRVLPRVVQLQFKFGPPELLQTECSPFSGTGCLLQPAGLRVSPLALHLLGRESRPLRQLHPELYEAGQPPTRRSQRGGVSTLSNCQIFKFPPFWRDAGKQLSRLPPIRGLIIKILIPLGETYISLFNWPIHGHNMPRSTFICHPIRRSN